MRRPALLHLWARATANPADLATGGSDSTKSCRCSGIAIGLLWSIRLIPLQTSAGVETVETNANQLDVVRTVLDQLSKAKHVRPVIFTDAELKVVPETDAAGVTAYREALSSLLGKTEVQSLPHEEIISKLDEAGKTFHVLVLKTNMTIPYTSVFIRLECGYWSADAEKRLREKMAGR